MNNSKLILFDFAGTLVKMRPAKLLVRRQMLIQLAKNSRLGIVTGARKNEALNTLDKLKIRYLFETVTTLDDSPFRKPDPRIFVFRPDIYIGDSPTGKLLAQRARVKFYQVNKYQNINQIIEKLLK